MTPRDPDFAARIRSSFAQQGALTALKAEMGAIEPGRCTIRAPFGPAVTQQAGLFHGGVIGTVADSAGGYAAMSLSEAGAEVVTVEYKINFLRPARGDWLEARGHVLRAGRSLCVSQVEVSMVGGEVCAVMQQTIHVIAAVG